MKEILLVEDDKRLGPTLKKGLEEQGYGVRLAAGSGAALELLEAGFPDLMVLDLGLPDGDGIDLLGAVRARACACPVLILTARDSVSDKVNGLDAGASDYLVKPFAFAELLARLRVLLRRSSSSRQTLGVGDVVIDLLTRHATRAGQTVDLTPREFDVLAYLAHHEGQVVSRSMLMEHVWREPSRFTSLDNVIDVHVSRLRKKLADESGASPIRVIRGVGITLSGSE